MLFLTALSIFGLLATSGLAAPTGNNDVLVKRNNTGYTSEGNFKCVTPGHVAPIFTNGPYELTNPTILKLLKEYKGKATFMVNGNNWRCIYNQQEGLRAAQAAGMEFGSLTWSQVDVTNLTKTELIAQLSYLEEAMMKILGVKLRFFMAPYDKMNSTAAQIIEERGYKIVRYTIDIGDSTTNVGNPQGSIDLFQKFVKENPKGCGAASFIATEPNVNTTNQALEPVFKLLTENNYKLVNLSTCLNVYPYQSKTVEPCPKAKEMTCDNTPAPGNATIPLSSH